MTDVRITALYTYPIKSCGGLSHEHILLTSRGLAYDRQWMFVDEAGRFLSQREYARLALIRPMITREALVLSAPHMPSISIALQAPIHAPHREVIVWQDPCQAWDEGDFVAEWASHLLEMPVRLVRMADDFTRWTSDKYTSHPAPVGFSDGYPLLLVSQESLDDLNNRLKARNKAAVPMSRFRPNVVIEGSGIPFYEDTVQRVRLGDVPFDVVKPCARCVMTTIDQETGVAPDPHEPTATLATFRRSAEGKVLFGQNVIHRKEGLLRVGDEVR